jgi:hypothetical protein
MIFIYYLSPVSNFLKATAYMVFRGTDAGDRWGGQIAESMAIQRNLTHINAIEGTVGVQIGCVTRVDREPNQHQADSSRYDAKETTDEQ